MEATFEPPISLYHLSGGLQLLVGSNQFFWFMSPHADEPLLGKFNGTEEYIVARLIADLKVIGIDRYETVEELKETVSDAFLFSVGPSCYVTEQIQNWFGISNALDKENSRLASRVAAQLQLCLHRLKKLSVSYRNALISTNPPVDCEFQAHNNKHSKNMASEYRSLLNELYSLRDAINTIYYKLCCKREDAYRSKSLKKILTSANRSDAGNLIFQSMFEGDRLIHKMSTLRSIALHIIPFTNPIMSDVFMLIRTNTEFGHIPRVVVPLMPYFVLRMQEMSSAIWLVMII